MLEGELLVDHDGGTLTVPAFRTVVAEPGEWVRYRTPHGARYVAVCLPAFHPDTVHRDAD